MEVTGGDEGGSGSGVGSGPPHGGANEPTQIEIKSDINNPQCATFIVTNEDHTLANPLRFLLAKNPDVEFAGYSIPHPSHPKVNIRVQTKNGTATDAFQQGLSSLSEVSTHISAVFEAALLTK